MRNDIEQFLSNSYSREIDLYLKHLEVGNEGSNFSRWLWNTD